MKKIKLRVFAASSYIPFAITLLFFSTNIVIRVSLILSVIPSVIVGLKSSQKNDVWEKSHLILDCLIQPWMRIELAIAGIVMTLTLDRTTLLLIILITVFFMFFGALGLMIWLYATLGAIDEDEE